MANSPSSTLSLLSEAADQFGLPHSPRVATEGDVVASDIVWLGEGMAAVALVVYADGSEMLVYRTVKGDAFDINLDGAKELFASAKA